jgi:hypothetical protein
MCWALESGLVTASPASESPPELELEDAAEVAPELLLGLLELVEPELPQAATVIPHVIAISVNRSVLYIVHRPPQ